MSTLIPITLTPEQNDLGKRHRHLNLLVNKAYTSGVDFESIHDVPEDSPLDRLFKIDLASKLRNVDYILKTLKDEDILYVSRALKSKWLLDSSYQDIINPSYLENVLYPSMWTTAVKKMKNWLYLNLKEPQRCQQFYMHYCESKFEFAIKFLSNCGTAFILTETPKILEKLTPHYFKILCEKCSQVAKIYFDELHNNDSLMTKFLKSEHDYYKGLKVVLKLNADIYFNVKEKYFGKKFSRPVTKYIMKHHRNRFESKPELYTALLLHLETLAECLSANECKEIVLKLARAKYLSYCFTYKHVEPLIKRLSANERSAFKKRVFVEKDIGELVKKWPYESPTLPRVEYSGEHIFRDRETTSYEYEYDCCMADMELCSAYMRRAPVKTYLDQLFDQYRFVGFEKTLFELRKKIGAESSPQNRQYMMLVLVSKSGARSEFITSLLQLLEQHLNEPAHMRATIVRSFVKRAAVWRLPQVTWEMFMKFAHGLGLDGSTPEADCREGLHAVVLRSLLETGTCKPAIRDAFIREFSTLIEYSTNISEKTVVSEKLPALLLSSISPDTDSKLQAERLNLVFDTLQSCKVKKDNNSFISAVIYLANRDLSAAEGLLRRLFDAKVARRILFKENFSLIQTDASYVNALRHDINIINIDKFVDLVEKSNTQGKHFLRKISVYFSEERGLSDCCLTLMKKRVLENDVKPVIARPICILMGANLTYLRTLDESQKHSEKVSAAIRANIHMGRLKLDVNEMSLNEIGCKAVANKVLSCPATEVDGYIEMLLKWKRTTKLAIILAQRVEKELEVFAAAASINPKAALKVAIKYIHRRGDSFNPHVWDVIKPLIEKIDFSKESCHHFCDLLCDVKSTPLSIRPEYCTIMFKSFQNTSHPKAMVFLSYIDVLLPNVNDKFIELHLLHTLKVLSSKKVSTWKDDDTLSVNLRILIKYLMLSESEEAHKERMEIVGGPFLHCIASLYTTRECKDQFMTFHKEILLTLRYNTVFFDAKYVSPLPVMEKIVSWMREILPTEMYFQKYVHIHLTMLYCKSIRQSIKQVPEVFANEKRRLKEGVDIVGHTFGRYIAQEVKQLMSTYFPSIIELYQNGLQQYLYTYFEYDVTKFQLIASMIKGVLEESNGAESKVAVYIFDSEKYNMNDSVKEQLLDEIKKRENLEIKLFLFANITA